VERSSWWTPRAIKIHLTLAVLVPAFVELFWWQLHRALAGNGLSWAYTIEWPVFLVYAVFMWWRLLHDTAEPPADHNTIADDNAVADNAVADEPKEAPVASQRPTRSPTWLTQRSTARRTTALTRAAEEDRQLAAYNAYLKTLDADGRPQAPGNVEEAADGAK